MLSVGVDWAEAEHAACLLDATGAVVRRLTIPQRRAGLARLRAAIAAVEPEPVAVQVAIERPDGLLVDGLLEAGYVVYALNPKAVDRYRERTRLSGGKTDPADAELLARILVTDRDRHQPLRPSGAVVEELRVLARQDEVAGRDQTRVQNRLHQDLLAAFPAFLDAFPDRAALSALRFLERWSSATEAGALSEAELAAFLRTQGHNRPTPPRPASTRRCTPTSWRPRPTWLRPGPARSGSPPGSCSCSASSAPPGNSACARCWRATEPTLTARFC